MSDLKLLSELHDAELIECNNEVVSVGIVKQYILSGVVIDTLHLLSDEYIRTILSESYRLGKQGISNVKISANNDGERVYPDICCFCGSSMEFVRIKEYVSGHKGCFKCWVDGKIPKEYFDDTDAMKELQNSLENLKKRMLERIEEKREVYSDSWKICDLEHMKTRLGEVFMQYYEDPSEKNIVDVANMALFLYTRITERSEVR